MSSALYLADQVSASSTSPQPRILMVRFRAARRAAATQALSNRILVAFAVVATKQCIGCIVADDAFVFTVPIDTFAMLHREHSEQCHVAGQMDVPDIAYGFATRADRIEKISPVLLDVLTVGRVEPGRLWADYPREFRPWGVERYSHQ